MRLLIPLLLLPLPAFAQDVDCATADTTVEMTFCATQEFEAADADLNDAYAAAVEAAQGYEGVQEDYLREAQRAWIEFRDAACSAEAVLFDGGSMQPMIGTQCMTRLSAVRAEDLWTYAEMGSY